MRSVKCHHIKIVQVVSKLVMPDSIVLPTTLSPHRAYLRLFVLVLTVELYYTVLMYKCS